MIATGSASGEGIAASIGSSATRSGSRALDGYANICSYGNAATSAG